MHVSVSTTIDLYNKGSVGVAILLTGLSCTPHASTVEAAAEFVYTVQIGGIATSSYPIAKGLFSADI